MVTLIVRCPFWAPTKVWSLGHAVSAVSQSPRRDQGQEAEAEKGKAGEAAERRSQPSHPAGTGGGADFPRGSWFPTRKLLVTGDSAYGGKSVLRKLTAHVELISHVHPKGALYEPAPDRQPGTLGGGQGKKGERLPGMVEWANDFRRTWKQLVFNQFGLHATLLVKTMQAVYYKAGKDRLLTIVLVRDVVGETPGPNVLLHPSRLEHEEDPFGVLGAVVDRSHLRKLQATAGLGRPCQPERESGTANSSYRVGVAQPDRGVVSPGEGHRHLQFPDRPWYPCKEEPSFADMLTTLRRLSWRGEFRTLPLQSRLARNAVAQIIEFLSLAG